MGFMSHCWFTLAGTSGSVYDLPILGGAVSQPARFSQPINNPGTRKHRSSQHDPQLKISQLSALFSIRYLLNPCFPDFTSKTLRILLILNEQREG
jgi:hypothetical protein